MCGSHICDINLMLSFLRLSMLFNNHGHDLHCYSRHFFLDDGDYRVSHLCWKTNEYRNISEYYYYYWNLQYINKQRQSGKTQLPLWTMESQSPSRHKLFNSYTPSSIYIKYLIKHTIYRVKHCIAWHNFPPIHRSIIYSTVSTSQWSSVVNWPKLTH